MIKLSNGFEDKAYSALSKLPTENYGSNLGIVKDQSKLIAFYLPQYHRIPENSEWWGKGFTEWTNVAKARPNFDGHYQPHIPKDLGFYDLENVEVMREQAQYAVQFGISAFCFHYYWFSGRRILEKPIDNFIASDIKIDFCFCWANENWTRTWSGESKNILLEQKYADGDEELFIQTLAVAFNDPRYIRVNNKPILVVYRIKEMPNPIESIKRWRAEALRLGFLGLHVAVVDFYDISDPAEVGADAMIEFPPHKYNGPQNHPVVIPTLTNPNFTGGIIDYRKIVLQSAFRSRPKFTLYRGIVPSWDNTARRQNAPTILLNSTPTAYGAWLKFLRNYTRLNIPSQEENFIFINAWNEWGEGCHLEPDLRWGLSYLEETYKSAFLDVVDDTTEARSQSLLVARNELIQKLSITSANEDGASLDNLVDQKVYEKQLQDYRPPSDIVRLIATKLTGVPFFYAVGKFMYKLFMRLGR